MAELIDEARAARENSQRLRAETVGLKLSCREQAMASRERLKSAEKTTLRVRSRRLEPRPSPWSSLKWAYDDDALQRVLVPLG